ncbi:hypothetical protein NN561_019919 [Cricetulus griseus]
MSIILGLSLNTQCTRSPEESHEVWAQCRDAGRQLPVYKLQQIWSTCSPHQKQQLLLVLVGNKCDLVTIAGDAHTAAAILAHKWGVPFVKTSAKTRQEHQHLFYVLFLAMYLTTVLGNLIIILLILLDSHLHTPMYFFLSNLSFSDLCFSSVTMPTLLENMQTQDSFISYVSCLTQMYFFMVFGDMESFLLVVMAYDRYVAICFPLHYTSIMSPKLCASLLLPLWMLTALHAMMHTLLMARLSFCKNNVILHFFCDISALLKLACSDTYINELMILIMSGLIAIVPFLLIVMSYARIVSSILKVSSTQGIQKIFSTCGSHLSVVSLFYGTIIGLYLCPSPNNSTVKETTMALMYTVVTPMLNPFIYSLRNRDIKGALRRVVYNYMRFTEFIEQNTGHVQQQDHHPSQPGQGGLHGIYPRAFCIGLDSVLQPYRQALFDLEQEVVDRIRSTAAEHLWKLMVEESDLLGQLKIIKDFSLLGQGELFQAFIDTAQHMLKTPPTAVTEHDVNVAFQQSAHKVLLDDDNLLPLLHLTIEYHGRTTKMPPSQEKGLLGKCPPPPREAPASGWAALGLSYKVQWPLHILFTPAVLEKYNVVFKYLLSVCRVQAELQHCWALQTQCKDLKSNQTDAVKWRLRNHMAFLVDDIQYHLQVDVLESQFSQLLHQINSTRDFESIQLAHNHFLSNLLAQSFILLKPVFHCLNEILDLCHSFYSLLYFFLTFGDMDIFLLATMAYDRFVAICHPLHYQMIMSFRRCSLLVTACWTLTNLVAMIHTFLIFRLSFCSKKVIPDFFCDLEPLMKIACSETRINELVLLFLGGAVILIPFLLILVSYIHIVAAILRVPSAQGRRKAFSTCGSHLAVVSLFFGTVIRAYLCPSSSSSSSNSVVEDTAAAVMYTVVTPLLNPFIYSLRNKDMKGALVRILRGKVSISWRQ